MMFVLCTVDTATMHTEDQGGRAVQEVASSLLAFMQTLQISGGTLIAWSDSCCGQNKNFLILCFLAIPLSKEEV